MTKQDKIQKALKRLSPDQQNFAKAVAATKVDNAMLQRQLVDLKAAYDDMWQILIVLVHAYPNKELRIHQSQFLRFKDEYRIDKSWDEKTQEVVLRLLTLHDDVE